MRKFVNETITRQKNEINFTFKHVGNGHWHFICNGEKLGQYFFSQVPQGAISAVFDSLIDAFFIGFEKGVRFQKLEIKKFYQDIMDTM